MSSISAFLVLACLSNVGEVASLAIPFVDVVLNLDFVMGSLNFNLHNKDSKVCPFLKATHIPCFWSSLFKFSENLGTKGKHRV